MVGYAPRVDEYRLRLHVEVAAGTFGGTVELDLRDITGSFLLNAVGLSVDDATCGGRPVAIAPAPDEEGVRVVDPPEGSATLRVRFAGRVTDGSLIGLYRCRYGSGSILTTQCQPTGTRRLFPCIDRPDRKARFLCELTVDNDDEVIFNMPVEREVREDGQVRRTFAPTPPMSTYLLYFGIGRFDWLRDGSGRVRIQVAAPPGRGPAGAFALDRSRLVLEALEQYFGIPYPLPKLDLVTVPEHAWGAMENWGAIAFRDVRLLVDSGTSALQRRMTLSTITHEIAHQWFGNLVTMAWWTDIWLNESFATLMEPTMVDRLVPGAAALDDLLLTWTSPSRFGDSLPSTHPVVAEVDSPDDIGQAFDDISYGKGASVLRMIEGYLGEEKFRRGVTEYLERFRYGNARSADLWAALEHASGEPVEAMMRAWLYRPGLPLIRVHGGKGGLELTQEKFSFTGDSTAEPWPIPLRYTVDGQPRTVLFRERSTTVPRDGLVILNPGGRGFYRVLYDAPHYDAIFGAYPRLPALDRWAILDDLSAFVRTGDVTPERYFAFADLERGGNSYLIQEEIVGELGEVALLFGPAHPLGRRALEYLRAQWERLGGSSRSGEPETDGVVRAHLAGTLVIVDPAFAARLSERYGRPEPIDGNLRGPVTAAYARVNGRPAFDRLFALLKEESREAQQFELEYALVSSRDPDLVREALAATGRPPMNRAHTAQIVRRAALNPEGRLPAWEWIQKNLSEFAASFPGTDLGGYVLLHSLPFVGVGRLAEVKDHFARHPVPLASRGAAKGLSHLEVTDRFYRRFA